MNKKTLLLILIIILFTAIGWFAHVFYIIPKKANNSAANKTNQEKPLDKYAIENLSKTEFKPTEIKVDGDMFEFFVDGKKVTGQIHTPQGSGPFPVVVMFRGYVDQEQYKTGIGTQRVAEVLAKNGYLTLAPDFLGYAGSDKEAENIFESRFQTYTTAATLLASVKNLPNWDKKNIFIWGHSNGGQISITALEILGVNYPTVLWAPVTKPFPYSILYYTDESDDKGKLIRSELAKFEDLYDVDRYSLSEYLDKINAPVLLLQGTSDDAVPVAWSDSFVKQMENLEKDVTYKKYPGADHNLVPSWSSATLQTLSFYQQKTKP